MLNLQNTVNQGIPVYITEEKFNEFILPHLWKGSRGPGTKISFYKLFHYILYMLYTGVQWKMLPVQNGADGHPEIHYSNVWRKWEQWSRKGSVRVIFEQSVKLLHQKGKLDLSLLHGDGTNTVAKKGGQSIGYSGHKHQKGDKIVPIGDNAGNILAPMVLAPVNQPDIVLLKEAIKALKSVCRRCGVQIPRNIPLNLDAGFDSKANRKVTWNAGLKPNIKENPRNRKKPKRGRKRYFDPELYKQRFSSERWFAWEDKFRRILVRYDWYDHNYLAFHLLAFSMINFRNTLN